MKAVLRDELQEWSLWLDEEATWEDGPQSVAAILDESIADWEPIPPSGGWDRLDEGTDVILPATTDAIRERYHGVSWWSTSIDVAAGEVLTLQFGAARLLAEVFWDRQLIAIDLEGYTPFEVVVPKDLCTEGTHRIDVRITNPGGTDGWEDMFPISWGESLIPSSHDFGGLWQPVVAQRSHGLFISDVWSRPSQDLGSALIDVTFQTDADAELTVAVSAPDGKRVGHATFSVPAGPSSVTNVTIPIENAALYGPGHPNLYAVSVSLESRDRSDTFTRNLGFRLLDAPESSLVYNGEPMFFRTAISWSRYGSGPVPTAEEISNEVNSLVALGQNAVSAHRRCTIPAVADALDEAGLLLYQEPGGLPSLRPLLKETWFSDDPAALINVLMKRRIDRLVKRDRSRACLVWWNLGNEIYDAGDGDPGQVGWSMINSLREQDDSRLTTFTSAWNPTPMYRPYVETVGRSFDQHTVFNWPAGWNRDAESGFTALRPPTPMLFLSGESKNMCGLGWLPLQAAHPDSEGRQAKSWLDQLDTDLARIDPSGLLGGAAALCNATQEDHTYSVARMIEVNRANPDIDGLAINAWHSHSGIGAMGLTSPSRELAVFAEPIARANNPVAVTIARLPAVVRTGENVSGEILLLDEHMRCEGSVQLKVTLSTGESVSSVVDLGSAPSRRHSLGSFDIPSKTSGLATVDVEVSGSGFNVRTEMTFRSVWPADIGGSRISLHDPFGKAGRFLTEADVTHTPWRFFDDSPTLICGGNIDPYPTLKLSPGGRAVVLLENEEPRNTGATSVPLHAGEFFEPDVDISNFKLPVHGHWFGGWGFTVPNDVVPTLGDAGVWDWTLNSVLPAFGLSKLRGRAISGAITPLTNDFFSLDAFTALHTSAIVKHGNKELLLTTLPLLDKIDHDPLAQAVLSDMLAWSVRSD